MKTRRSWICVSSITLFTVAFTVALYYVLAETSLYRERFICVYLGPLFGIVVARLLMLTAGTVQGLHTRAMDDIAGELIRRRYVVDKTGDIIFVRLDGHVGVRIRARPLDHVSKISYGVWETPRGVGVIMLFAVIIPPLAFLLFMHSLSKTIVFGERVLDDIIKRPSSAGRERKQGIRELLIESLSDARRISLEAYETYRSNYEDYLILSGLGGLIVAAIGVFMLGMYSFSSLAGAEAFSSLFVGVSAIVLIVLPLSFILFFRWKSKPKLNDLRNWRDLLCITFEAELAPSKDVMTPDSLFEFLAKVSKEMPGWIEIRRRSLLAREPFLSMVIFWTILIGIGTAVVGVIAVLSGDIDALAAALIGSGILGSGLSLYYLSNKRRTAEAVALRRAWERRSSQLGMQIESLLGGAR